MRKLVGVVLSSLLALGSANAQLQNGGVTVPGSNTAVVTDVTGNVTDQNGNSVNIGDRLANEGTIVTAGDATVTVDVLDAAGNVIESITVPAGNDFVYVIDANGLVNYSIVAAGAAPGLLTPILVVGGGIAAGVAIADDDDNPAPTVVTPAPDNETN